MARRRGARKSAPRRRRNTALKLIPLASGYVSFDAITRTMFNVDPIKFFMGGTSAGLGAPYASGITKISFNELFNFDKYKGTSDYAKGQNLGGQIWENVKDNWVMGGLQLMAAGAAPKILNKLPGRPVQKMNRVLDQVGIGSIVKL
jgi:hypothetical protein